MSEEKTEFNRYAPSRIKFERRDMGMKFYHSTILNIKNKAKQTFLQIFQCGTEE